MCMDELSSGKMVENRKRSAAMLLGDDVAGHQETDDDELDCLGAAPSDAEATIMLLRNKLYPDPASAAAAASAAKQSRHAKRSKAATGPSKAAAAAITAAAAAAAAAKQLPPIVLKSQLYTVLTDRTAADKDLEGLRRDGRVHVFKLAIGADEYVLLLAEDYLAIINRLIQKYQLLAQQLHQQPPAHSHADSKQASSTSAAENAGIAATLQLFRDRVVPVWRDSSVPRSTLLQLLRTRPSAPTAADETAFSAAHGNTSTSAQTAAAARSRAMAVALAGADKEAAAHERHLLAVDLITRDTRSPDSYLLTIPGAAVFVKSVVAGRQELLRLLSRKKYNEMLETELVCVKLRNSCLTPGFIARDLQGRGLITLSDTPAGPLVRLTQRK